MYDSILLAAVDLTHGAVLCFLCSSYVYDPELEEIGRQQSHLAAESVGEDIQSALHVKHSIFYSEQGFRVLCISFCLPYTFLYQVSDPDSFPGNPPVKM